MSLNFIFVFIIVQFGGLFKAVGGLEQKQQWANKEHLGCDLRFFLVLHCRYPNKKFAEPEINRRAIS